MEINNNNLIQKLTIIIRKRPPNVLADALVFCKTCNNSSSHDVAKVSEPMHNKKNHNTTRNACVLARAALRGEVYIAIVLIHLLSPRRLRR